MALRYRWEEKQIRELLAPALAGGETIVSFDTLTDAERFRFACYNLRRRKGIGRGLSFILNEVLGDLRRPINEAYLDVNHNSKFEVLVTPTPVFEVKRVVTAVLVPSTEEPV